VCSGGNGVRLSGFFFCLAAVRGYMAVYIEEVVIVKRITLVILENDESSSPEAQTRS
jgi:hypothetical protein